VLADGPVRSPGHASTARSWGICESGWREPQQGAERRGGRRSGRHLRRSGDRRDREARHGCGVPHQRLSALCSPAFAPLELRRASLRHERRRRIREQKKAKGTRPFNRVAKRWLFANQIEAVREASTRDRG